MPDRLHHYHIDLIRLISILAIIIIHISGIIFNLHPKIDGAAWSLSLVLQSIFRWGTPLFVMISGYLLLNSSSSSTPSVFYRRRLNRLLIPFVFWCIVYYLLDARLQSFNPSLIDFVSRIWRAEIYYHLYFLFLIIGLYLITPLLKKISHRQSILNFMVPLLTTWSFLYTFGAVWLAWPQLNLFYNWFVLYIGYYLGGIWISRLNIKFRWWYGLALILPLIGVIIDVYFINIFGISDKGTLLTHRLSPLIAIPAFVIFTKLISIGNEFFEKHRLGRIRALADLSMGVYLIHPLILEIFTKTPIFRDFLYREPLGWMSITFILLVPLSTASVFLIKKIPLLSSVV